MVSSFKKSFADNTIEDRLEDEYRQTILYLRGLDADGTPLTPERQAILDKKYRNLDKSVADAKDQKLARLIWSEIMEMRRAMVSAEDRIDEFRARFKSVDFMFRNLQRKIMR